jgi:rhamnopyranosyl-N-acetylglucosaminyl-diphospho-decaprenol beta-1,3/1,4-galactofuranosyltransferase
MIGHPGAVAAVVTGECAKLLTEYLTILDAQPRWPEVGAVGNPSTDGSQEMFGTRFPDVHRVTLTCDTERAGGFSSDLLWPADDDAITSMTALADFLASANVCGSGLGLVTSRVLWVDGRDQPRHVPRDPARASKAHPCEARAAGGPAMPQASFVSLLIEAGAIRELGLPAVDFMIWNDDFEFTPGIARHRKSVHAPHAIVSHLTTELGIKREAPGELFHHGVHDKMRDMRAGDAVAPQEAGMRFGSAQRNRALSYPPCHHKAAMRGGLMKGPCGELRTRPRPTREVLAGAGCELAPQR